MNFSHCWVDKNIGGGGYWYCFIVSQTVKDKLTRDLKILAATFKLKRHHTFVEVLNGNIFNSL